MTFERWGKIVDSLYFTPEFVRGPLSAAIEATICYGRFVILDEKLRKYTGANSPCVVYVPNKPGGAGHWVSQLGVILDKSWLPFVTKMFPFCHCAGW